MAVVASNGMADAVVYCANCGTRGHVYRNCNQPVTSCGVICYRMVAGPTGVVEPAYLMVQRKDSLCYIEFLRGKYSIKNRTYVMRLFEHMTPRERAAVRSSSFEELWKDLWQLNECNVHVREFTDARAKFDTLRAGYLIRGRDSSTTFFSLAFALDNTHSEMQDTEWGFPKGRRNMNESDVQCALREFAEETGIPATDVTLCNRSKPFEEIFTGMNRVRYRHVYFTATLIPAPGTPPASSGAPFTPCSSIQAKEVRDVRWFTYDAAQARIRPENVERKELLKRIHAGITRQASHP